MITQTILKKNAVYSICEQSGDIEKGTQFTGVCFADCEYRTIPENMPIVCCGQYGEDEILFRSKDGRYRFSIIDGWGEKDGVLYGLKQGLYYDFERPATDEAVLSAYENLPGDYRSWSGAMAYHAKKQTLEKIAAVLKKEGTYEGISAEKSERIQS